MTGPALTPDARCDALADLGFLASPDLPDRPGPASLLVAIRATPTLRHFDPESLDYWVAEGGRGARRTLDRDTPMPLEADLSWGQIQIVDRLKVTNEYLTFGGHLTRPRSMASRSSSSPHRRRSSGVAGTHSAGTMVPRASGPSSAGSSWRSTTPRASSRASRPPTPQTRYAAFLIDAATRFRASPSLRASQPDLWVLLDTAERRLRRRDPASWTLRRRPVARRRTSNRAGRRPGRSGRPSPTHARRPRPARSRPSVGSGDPSRRPGRSRTRPAATISPRARR